MNDGTQSLLAAAREHTLRTNGTRRTAVHVVMCHNLDTQQSDLMRVFGLRDAFPSAVEAVAESLARSILDQVAALRGELDAIEAFARRQLARVGDAGQ